MNYVLVGLGVLFTAVAVVAIRRSRRQSQKPPLNEAEPGAAASAPDRET